MRVAHFSDTHIGFRSYAKVDKQGINQREVDVFKTFELFLEDIFDQEPDLIIHTGDFFHQVRPGNLSLLNAFRRLSNLQKRRGGLPFVIIAGNHESPRSVESGCILKLFEDIEGISVAAEKISSVTAGEIEICCIPYLGWPHKESTSVVPSSTSKYKMVAAHGLDSSIKNISPDFRMSELNPDKWDYIALGDYHIHKPLADNAHYSGSTDFTSSNIWEETRHKKGWVLADLEKRTAVFREVQPVRNVMDLEPFSAEGLSGEQIGERLLQGSAWGEEEMPIVRQRVTDVDPAARSSIPADVLRELKAKCLEYKFEAQMVRKSTSSFRLGVGRSVEDNWRDYAEERKLPKEIERKEYIETGVKTLKEVAGDSSED